jgi:co-chaperonin GroES (HSP10)
VIVLGHRVLIKPDAQPDRTDSGLILTEDREYVATSGTVVQVGPGGSKLKYDARQRAIKQCIEGVRGDDARSIWKLLGTADPVPDVKVGDRVAFDGDTGLAIAVDGDQFLILNQDDIVIIVEEAEAA